MSRRDARRVFLVISQVYVPDPTAVGQHMADAAESLAARGHDVRVLTSARGYDDPSIRYPSRERRRGVSIVRLPLASFGKQNIAIRLVGAMSFLAQSIIRGLFTRRLGCIVVSTSPPMCSVAGLVIGLLRRVPVKYWVMDLNPDQMIQLGRISQHSFSARAFDWLNRRILARADDVIVLDRFMAERILNKRDVSEKLTILPPWPHEDVLESVPRQQNPFIEMHGLRGKRVIMYSGNHSIASPLATLIDAALRLRDDPTLVFMFIGGGLGKREVDQAIETHRPPNMIALPYQPLEQIKYSLSAADVHVASLGDTMVGVIHPCKVYGAMAVARPLLVFGPAPSHLSELVEQHAIGWNIPHGDVAGTVRRLREIAAMPDEQLAAMGRIARQAVSSHFSKARLCDAFCRVVERGVVPQITETPAVETPSVPLAGAVPGELAHGQVAEPAAPHGLEGKHVLVLGGFPFLRRALRRELSRLAEIRITFAGRPRVAAPSAAQESLIRSLRPDAVILLPSPLDETAADRPAAPRFANETLASSAGSIVSRGAEAARRSGVQRWVKVELGPVDDSVGPPEGLLHAPVILDSGARVVTISLPEIYGPRDRSDRPGANSVFHWIERILAARDAHAESLVIAADPRQVRQYLHIRDAARVIAAACGPLEVAEELLERQVVLADNRQVVEMLCDLAAYRGAIDWDAGSATGGAALQTLETMRETEDPLTLPSHRTPGRGYSDAPLAHAVPVRDAATLRDGLIETMAWHERHRAIRSSTRRDQVTEQPTA